MGKRKERRLAALSNAGRRVKLDLFAEPSGDLGASSGNEEGGKDIGPTQNAGLSNSPSSSGRKPQNPLLLLGQYTDDDLDEEPNIRPSNAENSSSDNDGQEGLPSEGEVDADVNEDLIAQKGELPSTERDSTPVDIVQSLEVCNSGQSDPGAATDEGKGIDLVKEASDSGISNAVVNGDLHSGWRMVLHEESNQYYYWNTETGETSWEVPEVLAQTTLSVSHQLIPHFENLDSSLADTNQSSSTLGIELDGSSTAVATGSSAGASLTSQSLEMHAYGAQTKVWEEGCGSEILKYKDSVADAHQSESQNNLAAADILLGAEVTNDKPENEVDLPTNLITQCECLLERLKSLEGYESRLQNHEHMLKYVTEVNIRLHDIKSLSSYASALSPFWIHSQRQLKALEDIINNEIYHLAVSAQMNDDADVSTMAPGEKDKSCDNMRRASNTEECENSKESESLNFANSEDDLHDDLDKNVKDSHVCSLGPYREHLEGGVVGDKVNGTVYPEDHESGEIIDMDVDMEVDDGVSTGITTWGDDSSTELSAPVKQPSRGNTRAEFSSLSSGDEWKAPPPPEEEWIPPPPPDSDLVPPPPPDNDQIPPPPPDEPPGSSYPPLPSYAETGQPLSYTDQYNLTYPNSNFQYYGPAVSVPSGSLYGHVDGSQVALPHASIYYEAVPNTYVETAHVIINPSDPTAYYSAQGGSVPPVPAVSITDSSHLHAGTQVMGYSSFASDQIRTIDDPTEASQRLKVDVSTAAVETVTASACAVPTSTSRTAAANVEANISSPSTSTMASLSTAPTKGQSKVSRVKKRTIAVAPSLRSNKKVSSLVDKWKAAKEELNENEEDEPETALEILERKRQREIEEWHAKQIASGEAKDNANFQPLGGDWRERVKRRRAEKAKEAAKAQKDAPIVENQQPDLAELSKGLPSGWQAYWDESSKQVYYGNAVTSETTWSKPTK